MLLRADFIPMCGNDALVGMFQSGTSVSVRSISENDAQSGTHTAFLDFSHNSNNWIGRPTLCCGVPGLVARRPAGDFCMFIAA